MNSDNGEREQLRRLVLDSLRAQGFEYDAERGKLLLPKRADKETLRCLHAQACAYQRQKAAAGIRRFEDRCIAQLARGDELDPMRIDPELRLVERNTFDEILFRWTRLHWSVPVSAGYGRRLRFLVWDRAHDRLIGVIGLNDPVFALRPRDAWIGWSRDQKRERISAVLDAFVLGAVPPYRELLGGKLVALLVAANEIRAAFAARYGSGRTTIRRRPRDGRLVLVTTMSALGRSSIYNRLRYRELRLYQSVGYSSGSGEFQFHNSVYTKLRKIAGVHATPSAKHKAWGEGWRNRREVVHLALPLLGLSSKLVWHGIRREVFVVPLAYNASAYLRGEATAPEPFDLPAAELAAWHHERWLLPRARRTDEWRAFDPESWRLYPKT